MQPPPLYHQPTQPHEKVRKVWAQSNRKINMNIKIDIRTTPHGIVIHKNVRGKVLEINSTRPNIMYMQYGYSGGVGPWHSTSAIHYGNNKFGYDTPDLWPQSVRKVMPAMFAFIAEYNALGTKKN